MNIVSVSHARVHIRHDCPSVIEYVVHADGTVIPRQVPVDVARNIELVMTTAILRVSS
jgi:hypothetical protein